MSAHYGPSKEYAAGHAKSWRRHVVAGYACAAFALCVAVFCLWVARRTLWLGVPLFAFNCWNAWRMLSMVPEARRRAESFERGEWPKAAP